MQKRLSVIFVWAILSVSSAYGQLGPKDGADMKPSDLNRVKIGHPAPDFTLEDMNGRKISLSDFRGKKNVVLVFNRGYW